LTEPYARAPLPARAEAPSLALSGHVGPEEVAGLCDRVRESSSVAAEGPIRCDCRGIADPDVGTIEALARMALVARRLGRRLELQWSRPDLIELLILVGLDELAVEVRRQPEEREEALGVEEERDPADPIA
jgi:hypothetical protein